MTQLEIGHYLNSRLSELRFCCGRLDARPGPGPSRREIRVQPASGWAFTGPELRGGRGWARARTRGLGASRSTYTVLIPSACNRRDCNKV